MELLLKSKWVFMHFDSLTIVGQPFSNSSLSKFFDLQNIGLQLEESL